MGKRADTGKARERIAKLRDEIDALDEKIQAAVTRRARHAREIGEIKRSAGMENVYRPEREAEVLSRVVARNQGPLPNESLVQVFREIISGCRGLEAQLRIAFLGPEGTYTQEAALRHFGHAVQTLALSAIDEVFRDVEAGHAQFGVVPVENSTEGVINHTLDMFMVSPLRICGEIELPIHHHLMAKGATLDGAKRVLSHQQSLAQCREWLDANLPGIERVAVSSNAEAARRAAADNSAVAIAGESAARLYGLSVLASNIEDRPDNTTRFLVIGKVEPPASGRDKTSLLLSGRNVPGALHRLLAPLARHGVNMTRIESRPSHEKPWEYVFFLDVEGHVRDRRFKTVLKALEKEAAFVKWLGSYPRAVA